MYKPVADIMRDEAGNPEVMQHALTFDYIPVIKPKYNQRNMEHGGVIHFGETPTDEEEEDEDLTELERLATRVQELEDAQKPNINQPVGDDGPGPEGTGGNQGAGFNSLSGTVAALSNLGTTLSNISNPKLGQVALGALTGKTVQPNVPTRSENIKGTIDFTTDEQQAEIDKADQEFGEGFTFGPPLTAQEKSEIESEKENVIEEIEKEEEEAQAEHSTSGIGTSSSTGDNSGDTDGDGDTGVEGGGASGGLIKGYQEGAMVEEQADTTMDTAGLGPMGLVDDMDGDQVTGVEDDLNMETEEGAYVLNADAVELVGLKDLNQLTKDAIDIAIESDIPLPKTVDPTKKVPIKISNGEYVIPAILVPIIGLENLEKMNKRGLEYREKNREEAPPQEAQQQDVPVEPSEVPSRGVPGEINLAQGGVLADQMNRLMQSFYHSLLTMV